VNETVGKADYTTPVPMRPDQGYVSLVSLHILLLFLLPFLLNLIVLLPFSGVAGLPNRPISGPEDTADRAARRLAAEEKKKKKKHADKKQAH
jgi:hypothetical protein